MKSVIKETHKNIKPQYWRLSWVTTTPSFTLRMENSPELQTASRSSAGEWAGPGRPWCSEIEGSGKENRSWDRLISEEVWGKLFGFVGPLFFHLHKESKLALILLNSTGRKWDNLCDGLSTVSSS